MTITELRTQLETALTSELGTYKFTGGTTKPAIIVGAKTPAGCTVSGLEVCIHRTPNMNFQKKLCNGVVVKQAWQVVLKRWDETQASPKGLETALRLAAKAFTFDADPIVLHETDDVIEQAFISILDFDSL